MPSATDHSVPRKGPAYRIVTERLVIRCWNPDDAPLLKSAKDASRDHLLPWMPWAASIPEELESEIKRLRHFRAEFDQDREYIYGIFDREETQALGGTGLHPHVGEGAMEIGYWIHGGWINQGLATETSAALTRVAFDIMGVDRVEIHCDPLNVSSASVPRKLGFVHEATLRRRVPIGDGEQRDAMIWSMMWDEYRETAAAQAEIEAFDVIGKRIV